MASSASTDSQSLPSSAEDVFEVEQIVDIRSVSEGDEYRIRWKGCPPEDDTWEPAANLLSGCRDLVLAFDRKREEAAAAAADEPTPVQEDEATSADVADVVVFADVEEEEEEPLASAEEEPIPLDHEDDVEMEAGASEQPPKEEVKEAPETSVDPSSPPAEEDEPEESDDEAAAEENSRARLKDTFWHDLEAGRTDVLESLGRKTRRRAAAASSPSPTPPPRTRRKAAETEDKPIRGRRRTRQARRGRGRGSATPSPAMDGDTSTSPAPSAASSDQQPSEPTPEPPPQTPTPEPTVTVPIPESNPSPAPALPVKKAEPEPKPKAPEPPKPQETPAPVTEIPPPEPTPPKPAPPKKPSRPAPKGLSEADWEERTRLRGDADRALPLALNFNLSLDQFTRDEMKTAQAEKGRAVSQKQLSEAVRSLEVETVRLALRWKKRYGHNYVIDPAAVPAGAKLPLLHLATGSRCDGTHAADDIVEYLVNMGAPVSQPAPGSAQTPLHIAAASRQLCKVMKLLSAGANPNGRDGRGATPLSLAVAVADVRIARRLLDAGADAEARVPDKQGKPSSPREMAQADRRTAGILKHHCDSLKAAFDYALREITGNELRVKSTQSRLHTFALTEAPDVEFEFDWSPVPLPHDRYGYVIAVGVGRIGPQGDWTARMWGTACPFASLQVNGVEQRSVQEEGRYLFTAWPLRPGRNVAKVVLSTRDVNGSTSKGLLQVLLCSVKAPAAWFPALSAGAQPPPPASVTGTGEEHSGFARIY